MSYTKQTWATGDVITASKMNHMEDGIASGGAYVFRSTGSPRVLDKTFAEIKDMIEAGVVLYECNVYNEYSPLNKLVYDNEGYFSITFDTSYNYIGNSADAYPTEDLG